MSLVQKGRSHQLLKKALLKRENDSIKEKEIKNQKLLESIPNLYDQIEDLKEALYRKEEEVKQFEEDSQILKDLHKQGYIDSNGNPTMPN